MDTKNISFSAMTLLVWWQEEHPACKKTEWWGAGVVSGAARGGSFTRQMHRKAVEQRATLIHRQYNRDWGTSYSRPPIDPYLTSPVTKSWRHWVWLSVWSEVQTCIWPS